MLQAFPQGNFLSLSQMCPFFHVLYFFVAGKSGARQHVSFNWKTGGLFFVVDFHVPFNELFFFLTKVCTYSEKLRNIVVLFRQSLPLNVYNTSINDVLLLLHCCCPYHN